jgi:hypothetical protein
MASERVGFTVYVEREILDQLKAQAKQDGRTLSSFVARLLAGKGDTYLPTRLYSQRSRVKG